MQSGEHSEFRGIGPPPEKWLRKDEKMRISYVTQFKASNAQLSYRTGGYLLYLQINELGRSGYCTHSEDFWMWFNLANNKLGVCGK